MGRSVLTTMIGLALNLVLLVYGVRFFDVKRQVTVLYTGDCSTVSIANITAHVGVNILATLLVSAASNTINYLTAPSREDLDKLHAKGQGAEVGIWDLRNWKLMSPLRRLLFCCAVLSSVPLHLFYNSIFTTTYVSDDWVGFVTPETFLQEEAWDTSFVIKTWPEAVSILKKVQQNATTGEMQRLEVNACKKVLQAPLVLNYSIILFITPTDSQRGTFQSGPLMYMQHDSIESLDVWTVASPSSQSDLSQLVLNHYNWIDLWNRTTASENAHDQVGASLSTVQYCLLQPQPEQCSIQLVPQLIVPVVLFNVLGALAGTMLFFQKSFEPIATFGDAISSFLTRPCPYSLPRPLTDIAHGQVQTLVSGEAEEASKKFIIRQITRLSNHKRSSLPEHGKHSIQSLRWYTSRARWHSGVTPARWLWTSLLFTLYWLSGLIGLAVVLAKSSDPGVALSQGIRAPLPPSSTSPSLTLNYDNAVANIVLANVFQLVLAVNYLFYQNILARMALGAEFNRFVTQRRQLRVSRPVGNQDTGYWFVLPHRLALALLAVSALLHFLISEAIFYEQLRPRAAIPGSARLAPNFNSSLIHAVICNPEALLVFEAVGLLAPAAAFTFGWLRRFDAGAPLVVGDSRVLAALSCHREEVPGSSEVLEPLQWGVIEETSEGGYVGFSSATVRPLESGKIYKLR